jgi:hypothetical protein
MGGSSMTLETHRQTVAGAVHSIWEEWSKSQRSFRGERPEMQVAFVEDLAHRLPSGWEVKREAKIAAPTGFSAWRMYDVGVFHRNQLVSLLELSYGDTNVPHALHNGELKLLGACDALGAKSGISYSGERALNATGVSSLCETLERLEMRGLFFINPGPRPSLDVEDKAIWFETKAKGFIGETRFKSAVMAPAERATLRQVFQALSRRGLSSWFYSLCGEDNIEELPSPLSAN